jgi:hypothetical protein
LFCFFVAASANNITVSAQVQQEWVARYDGPIGNSSASALAMDSAGNCYVTGFSCSQIAFGGCGQTDWATIKYDADGNELWAARYNDAAMWQAGASAVAVDSAANVYVTGQVCVYAACDELGCFCSGSDYATIKYDTQGNRLWVARYHGPGIGLDPDGAAAIVLDAVGNVYVTGTSVGDYATIKYDTDGNQLWVSRYHGSDDGSGAATGIALDATGKVYVTGTSGGAYATIKYDTDGNQLWVARYNGPGNGPDVAAAIVLDAVGDVYVTGSSVGVGTSDDYATIKYDTDGNQLWVARYDGPGNGEDRATAIALDAAGSVYVTGWSLGLGTSFDYATIKYDADGNQLWVARYDGPGNGADFANAIALDVAGSVYVTGRSLGLGTDSDYATIKYDTDGNQLWVTRYNGPGNDYDEATAIALGPVGNVYVTGGSTGVGRFDYATIKYSQR